MRAFPRSLVPGFLVASLLVQACAAGRSASPSPAVPPAGPPPPEYPNYAAGAPASAPMSEPQAVTMSTGAVDKDVVATADESESFSGESGGGEAAGSSQVNVPAAASEPQPNAHEMFDIEARISIEVERVEDAAERLRKLTKQYGGQIVSDNVNDDGSNASASFTLRVPAKGSEAFLNAVDGIGAVRSRQVTARDIGKEFHDAQIHLKNLELTLARFKEILEKAQNVSQILEIEREMTRIRGEIDQVKGNLTWMKDRVARATIYVTLYAPRPESPPTFNPKAKIYPGFRFLHLADFRGDKGNFGFFGGGLSVAFGRFFSFDVDGFRRIDGDGSGLDALLLTMGGETYSDFLGGGRRTWLNPYVGLRVGYARIFSKNEALAGATLGLEIFKSKFVRLDAETRLLGLFGNKDVGGHVALSSGLSVHVAF